MTISLEFPGYPVRPLGNSSASRRFLNLLIPPYVLTNQSLKAKLTQLLAVWRAVIFVCAGIVFLYYAIGQPEFAGKGGIIL
jgi:hypothetical protein